MRYSHCPVTIGFNHEGETSIIFCGKWSCKRCRKHNAGKWAKRAELGLNMLEDLPEADCWFLTLTLGSEYTLPEQGYKAIPRLWDTLRKAYQRYYGKFTYLAFVEAQPKKRKMPHFHILTTVQPPTKRGRRGYVTKHGLHDFAVAYGWGFEARMELVTSSQGAVYVAKYASKGDPSMPRNFRRVRVSRDWPKLPDLGGSPLLVPARLEDVPDYIARVADVTNISPDILYPRYAAAMDELDKLSTKV